MVDVSFTDDATDDLRRIGPATVPKVLKKLLILLTDPKAGYPLGGESTGYRKLVVGRNTWRIVYRIADHETIEICEVWAVGARADAEVYAKASARVREASVRPPAQVRLADAIERLGTLAGGSRSARRRRRSRCLTGWRTASSTPWEWRGKRWRPSTSSKRLTSGRIHLRPALLTRGLLTGWRRPVPYGSLAAQQQLRVIGGKQGAGRLGAARQCQPPRPAARWHRIAWRP